MSSILCTVDKGWENVNKLLYFRDTGTVQRKEETGEDTDEQEETLILLRTTLLMSNGLVVTQLSNKGVYPSWSPDQGSSLDTCQE